MMQNHQLLSVVALSLFTKNNNLGGLKVGKGFPNFLFISFLRFIGLSIEIKMFFKLLRLSLFIRVYHFLSGIHI